MRTPHLEQDQALERLLQASAPGGFRPGFAGRVLARLSVDANPQAQREQFWRWTWHFFPTTAVAAMLLVAGLAAWNLARKPDGAWLDRLLNLPAETLNNGLLAQMEDWT